jgi:hypothetical protein
MPEFTVVPLRTRKAEIDESLVTALMQLVERAKAGDIHHMVCVCTGDDDDLAHNVKYRTNSLTLIGAVGVTLAALQAEWIIQ